MDLVIHIGIFVLGIVLLYFGGVLIVEGSVQIARKLNIPLIIIGLTVVSMGTSMPELFVSLSASMKGSNTIALGNVIGSNIFNIVFVLGVSCFFMPLRCGKKSFDISMITMFVLYIMTTIMIFVIGSDIKQISTLEGVMLFLVLGIYIFLLNRLALEHKDEALDIEKQVVEVQKKESLIISIIKIIISIICLGFGANLFIDGSISIFSRFINEHVIGIIVVAVGTSIPELVTSVIAAYKKESDISVGNIVGSNIFNVGAVLGISAIVTDIQLENVQRYTIDFFIMFLSGILLYVFMAKNRPLKKWHGGTFLLIYVVYVIILVNTGRA